MPTSPPTLAAFTTPDWAVMGAYLALLVVTGWILSRRKPQATDDYFLGGRRMPVWAVAISVLATALSAATFIGVPQQSYVGDLTYLSANIGAVLAVIIVAIFFIPAFYRSGVATVYGLIGERFGPAAMQATSWTFMLGRIFASGARIYIAALPLTIILFTDEQATTPGRLVAAIAVITLVGVVYTIIGGIRSVIWTDVIQTFVFVGAALAAAILLLTRIPMDPPQIAEVLAATPTDNGSKLTTLKLGIDPRQPGLGFSPAATYTVLTAVIGFTIFNIAAFGTDQDLAQRMLTCKSAAAGSRSAIAAILIGLPVTALFMALGLLLYIFYRRQDLMGPAAPGYEPDDPRTVFLTFILREMPPGLTGLMMAGLFAAGLSTLNSGLNAMSSTFVSDFYKRIAPDRPDRHYVLIGRVAVAGWGLVLGSFACVCVWWHASSAERADETLIDFALGVMTFAYAGLAAVFLTAIFTRHGNGPSAIAALATGFIIVLALQPGPWAWLTSRTPWTAANGGEGPWRLGDLALAYPWRLLIGTGAAFAVCCMGQRRRSQGAEQGEDRGSGG
jgi:solute:Na+ symporter, SSS family